MVRLHPHPSTIDTPTRPSGKSRPHVKASRSNIVTYQAVPPTDDTRPSPARRATAQRIIIASAYRQLRPTEKHFVDRFTEELQARSDRDQIRLSVLLQEPVDMDKEGMLSRSTVLAAITERVTELAANAELSVDRIVREYGVIAFSNIMDVVELDGYGNPQFNLGAATPEQQRAIKKIDYEQTATGAVRLKIEMHDKLSALRTLADYTGMTEPDNPHWRARNASPVIDSHATVQDAADAYARMLASE